MPALSQFPALFSADGHVLESGVLSRQHEAFLFNQSASLGHAVEVAVCIRCAAGSTAAQLESTLQALCAASQHVKDGDKTAQVTDQELLVVCIFVDPPAVDEASTKSRAGVLEFAEKSLQVQHTLRCTFVPA
jgi:hypothetical protein